MQNTSNQLLTIFLGHSTHGQHRPRPSAQKPPRPRVSGNFGDMATSPTNPEAGKPVATLENVRLPNFPPSLSLGCQMAPAIQQTSPETGKRGKMRCCRSLGPNFPGFSGSGVKATMETLAGPKLPYLEAFPSASLNRKCQPVCQKSQSVKTVHGCQLTRQHFREISR